MSSDTNQPSSLFEDYREEIPMARIRAPVDQVFDIPGHVDAVSDSGEDQDEECACLTEGNPSVRYIPLKKRPKHYPKEEWRPIILRKPLLIFVLLFYGATLAAILFFEYLLHIGQRLHTVKESYFFASRYAPSIVSAISGIWIRSIIRNLALFSGLRTMATDHLVSDNSSGKLSSKVSRAMVSTIFARYNYGIHITEAWAARHFNLAALFFTAVIFNLIAVPLKATWLTSVTDDTGWEIQATPWVTHTLAVVYIVQFFALLFTTIRLWEARFGLIDEVSSLADLLRLFARSNMLPDLQGTEWKPMRLWSDALNGSNPSLGYWEIRCTHCNRILHYWHGIANASSTCQLIKHTPPKLDNHVDGVQDAEEPIERQPSPYSSSKRFASTGIYWYEHPISLTIIMALILAAVVGAVKLCIYQFEDSSPQPIKTRSQTVAAIITRFIPPILLNIVLIILFSADLRFRNLQAFASMEQPVLADRSLLLTYPYDLPGIVTLKALKNSHWKVAWMSSMQLVFSLFQTVVAAIFVTHRNPDGSISISMTSPALIATLAYLVLFLITIPLLWLTRKRRLPCSVDSLGDVMVLTNTSRMLKIKAFDYAEFDDSRAMLHAMIVVEKRHYAFGRFIGTDGEEHIGIDFAYDGVVHPAHDLPAEHVDTKLKRMRPIPFWPNRRRTS